MKIFNMRLGKIPFIAMKLNGNKNRMIYLIKEILSLMTLLGWLVDEIKTKRIKIVIKIDENV